MTPLGSRLRLRHRRLLCRRVFFLPPVMPVMMPMVPAASSASNHPDQCERQDQRARQASQQNRRMSHHLEVAFGYECRDHCHARPWLARILLLVFRGWFVVSFIFQRNIQALHAVTQGMPADLKVVSGPRQAEMVLLQHVR